MSKIIKAVFTGRFCKTPRVFRFDTDDKIQFVNVDLPANYTVDFSNSKTGDSVSVLATSNTVQIPPDLFIPGSEIYAWIWLSDSNGGHTRCEATIPIDPRARRTGTEPTPAQASAWDEAVDTLNETIEGIPAVINSALTEAKESGEFDGKNGKDGNGVWYVDVQYTRTISAGVQAQLNHMIGRPGATPAVKDLCVVSDGRFGSITSITPRVAVVPVLGDLSGADGYSPVVSITEIEGGHRITITDEAHPDGQSFDVMDGQGGSGSDAFVVTYTLGQTSSCNKTYAEIMTAWQTGQTVFARATGVAVGQTANVYVSQSGDLVVILTVTAASVVRLTHTSADTITWDLLGIDATDIQGLDQYINDKGYYTKPSSGIPETDMAEDVQTSLDKANTALQEHQSLTAYRTAQAQDVIDQQQNTAIAAKYSKPSGGIPKTDLAAAVQMDLMSDEVKQALLQLAQKVAYIDDQGQTYYQDLYDALYPPKTAVSISSAFTQGSTVVYDNASLDSLKTMLVVTATYDDSSTEVLQSTAYTLSGTLTPGTSTVTVTYNSLTTTFTVNVTAAPTLSSISAVYTQSGTVYDTDALDSLKADLVITAVYSDSSTETVAAEDYTLSGTLTEGTSTITVSYGGKTATFNVTVTHGTEILITNTYKTSAGSGSWVSSTPPFRVTTSGTAGWGLTITPNTTGLPSPKISDMLGHRCRLVVSSDWASSVSGSLLVVTVMGTTSANGTESRRAYKDYGVSPGSPNLDVDFVVSQAYFSNDASKYSASNYFTWRVYVNSDAGADVTFSVHLYDLGLEA